MKPELNTIARNTQLSGARDYEKLRALGLKYIEQFSREVWTDYNIHDPGVTIMEVLSYVITDLANRTALPIADIVAREPTKDGVTPVKDFFAAREILPCNAVTFDDLRKKIIDVEGVENAWVLPYTDDCCAEELAQPAYAISCETGEDAGFTLNGGGNEEKRNIHGLYQFNLLLEEDAQLGDLNLLCVDWDLWDAGVKRAQVRLTFPLELQKTYPAVSSSVPSLEMLSAGDVTGFSISPNPSVEENRLSILEAGTFDITLNTTEGDVTINQVAFHVQALRSTVSRGVLTLEMLEYLGNGGNNEEIITRIFTPLAEKVKKITHIIDDVYCQYHHIRNLCEDVIRIGIVPTQEIALCADIETENDVDLEEILAKVYFAVDTFFSPPVRFYLLKEMLDKGYSPEFIFEGPLLKHGFIPDDDLQKVSLFCEVHASDLYNLIMTIEGVKNLRYLQITNYLNGRSVKDSEFWLIDLEGPYHLNLDRRRSKVIFYKGEIPIAADKQVANAIYNQYKAEISKPRLNLSLQELNDIPLPVGTYYRLEDYYSAQNEFPMLYGTGKDGIPSESDITRKTKIKQLKGYLLFFDQLLANYLVQLAQVKELLSVSNRETRTYFAQPVYDTPFADGVNPNRYTTGAITLPEEDDRNFFDVAPLLNNFSMPAVDIDDPVAYETDWEDFVNRKDNGYRVTLDEITEPVDEKLDRRNRFLDHLLARFAETFADYAVMMYSFTGSTLESKEKKTAKEITEAKFDFLKDYDVLSYNRGKGQYYKVCPDGITNYEEGINPVDLRLEYDQQSSPDPKNPTGLHKRCAPMLGMSIKDNSDMVLNRFTVFRPGEAPDDQPDFFLFKVLLSNGHVLTSLNPCRGPMDLPTDLRVEPARRKAFEGIERLVEYMEEDSRNEIFLHFRVEDVAIVVYDSDESIYAVSDHYDNADAAEAGLKELKDMLLDEGMHVIEHLLLRPLPIRVVIDDTDLEEGFFPLCGGRGCECGTDYYSFRVSVVLPYWTPRFRNMDFRDFAEAAIHRETPVHILPKFCWVSMYDMDRLERAYDDWFEENKVYKPDMDELSGKLIELAKTLNTLTNVYPVGRLHDCDNPSTDNPVILNRTNLGTY